MRTDGFFKPTHCGGLLKRDLSLRVLVVIVKTFMTSTTSHVCSSQRSVLQMFAKWVRPVVISSRCSLIDDVFYRVITFSEDIFRPALIEGHFQFACSIVPTSMKCQIIQYFRLLLRLVFIYSFFLSHQFCCCLVKEAKWCIFYKQIVIRILLFSFVTEDIN